MRKLKLHVYQEETLNFIETHGNVGLFLEQGLGKTLITLTHIVRQKSKNSKYKTLIIAPLRVVYATWPNELSTWEHTKGLTYSIYHGDERKTFNAEADVLLINPEGLASFFKEHPTLQFNLLVVDESTLFKSWASKRFKLLKKQTDNNRFLQTLLLTGTPIPNGYLDLWSQIYLLDRGAALGKNITTYKATYFHPTGYRGYQYQLIPNAGDVIWRKVSKFCKALRNNGTLDLPKKIVRIEPYILDEDNAKKYKRLYRDFYLEFQDKPYIAPNTAVKLIKCQQFLSGCVYDEEKRCVEMHLLKIEALRDLLATLGGKSVLILYNYNTDLHMLEKYIDCEHEVINGKTSAKKSQVIVDKWNRKAVKVLYAHPAAMSHGLNLQFGGHHIIWFSLTYNLEQYLQTNARLYRQKQTNSVIISHLVASGSLDIAIYNTLQQKLATQETFLNRLQKELITLE